MTHIDARSGDGCHNALAAAIQTTIILAFSPAIILTLLVLWLAKPKK